MTWQESLRKLDGRLAKGEIGAAEYRKARDEILAEASSGANAAKERGDDLWTVANRRAVAAEEAAAAAETTLVVKMPPAGPPPAEAAEAAEADEPTQVVPADRIPAAPDQQPAPPAPAVQERSAAPPRPADVPADVRPMPYRAAPIQGQEVFAEAGPEGGNVFVRLLVPLLILAVVGAGVWWFAFRDGDEEQPAAQPPASESTPAPPGVDDIDGRLPELPGRANQNNGAMTLDRARELKLFTPTYAALLADNGAAEIAYRGAVRSGAGYLMVASPIPPANGADGVAVLTREHLQRAGFAPAEALSPEDPAVITRTDKAFRTFITVFSSGDVWVQLNVSGAPDGDEKALRDEFQKVLGSLTERLPAD